MQYKHANIGGWVSVQPRCSTRGMQTYNNQYCNNNYTTMSVLVVTFRPTVLASCIRSDRLESIGPFTSRGGSHDGWTEIAATSAHTPLPQIQDTVPFFSSDVSNELSPSFTCIVMSTLITRWLPLMKHTLGRKNFTTNSSVLGSLCSLIRNFFQPAQRL